MIHAALFFGGRMRKNYFTFTNLISTMV